MITPDNYIRCNLPSRQVQATRELFHSWLVIVFYVLYFSWDRLSELSFLLGSKAGIARIVLILLLWIYAVIKIPIFRHQIPHYRLLIKYLQVVSLLSLCLAIQSIFQGISYKAIIYTLIQTIGFYPLVFFFMHICRSRYYVQRLLWVLLLSCFLLAIGLIIDNLFGISNLILLPGLEDSITIVDSLDLRRGNFIVGSTNGFIMLSIGMIAGYLLTKYFNPAKPGIILFLIVGITTGLYLTYSRLSAIFGIIFFSIIMFNLIRTKKLIGGIVPIFIALVFCFFLLPKTIDILPDTMREKYVYLFDRYGTGNLGRFDGWEEGIALFKDPTRWLGVGLGTSNPRLSFLFSIPYMGHYESSVFLTFSEGGFTGLLLLLFPFAIICFSVLRRGVDNIFLAWSILVLLNLFVSPIITGYRPRMVIYSLVGLTLLFSVLPSKGPAS